MPESTLKPAAKLILHALESANRELQEPVRICDIIKHLTKHEILQLEKSYRSNCGQTVIKQLLVLKSHGLASAYCKIGNNTYHVSNSFVKTQFPLGFSVKFSSLPFPQQVRELVTEAVNFFKYPLRTSQVVAFAAGHEKYSCLNPLKIRLIIQNLVKSGYLIRTGTVTGAETGTYFYTLPEVGSAGHGDLVQGRIQAVMKAFNHLWESKLHEAGDGLPKPVSTREMRQYIKLNYVGIFKNTNLISAVLHSLIIPKTRLIRKINRSKNKSVGWVPSSYKDSQINLSDYYANNIEKMVTLIKRACNNLQRPVCSKEIKKFIKADKTLALDITVSLAEYLSGGTVSTKRSKKHKNIYSVGHVKGNTYYIYGTKSDAERAEIYTLFLETRLKWAQSKGRRQLENIESCYLPTVAAGRARLILSVTEQIAVQLEKIIKTDVLNAEDKREADILLKDVSNVITQAYEWIKLKEVNKLNLPEKVDETVPGWVSEELLPVLLPLYPAAPKTETPNKLVVLLEKEIRRVPNPKFKIRFSRNPNEAAMFLFDRTDALLTAACRWGGCEAVFQAMLAGNELGYLRDARFVIPAITSANFDERLSAVACLAFLGNANGNEVLRKCLFEDPDCHIRQSAVWAYAFTNKSDVRQTLEMVAKNDPSENVRNYARLIAKTEYKELWTI